MVLIASIRGIEKEAIQDFGARAWVVTAAKPAPLTRVITCLSLATPAIAAALAILCTRTTGALAPTSPVIAPITRRRAGPRFRAAVPTTCRVLLTRATFGLEVSAAYSPTADVIGGAV